MTLQEEFSQAKTEALALVEKAKTESRALTAEEKEGVEKRYSRMSEIKSIQDTHKQLSSLDLEVEDVKEVAKKIVTQSFSKGETKDMEKKDIMTPEEAARIFARTGRIPEEFTLTSGTSSGLLMPKSIPGNYQLRVIQNAYRRGFDALGVPTFGTGSYTDNMSLPVMDDSSNTANNNAEGATSGTNADASPADLALNLVEYHGKAEWYSKKLINAQSFDITQAVLPRQLSRINRKEDSDWSTVLIADTAIVGKTTASTTAVTLAELQAWDETMEGAQGGTPQFYAMSAALRAAVRVLADSTNRPFFSIDERGLARMFGKPVFVSSTLEVMTAGKVIGALVSVDGTIIRDVDVNEFVRYEGESIRPAQIGFEAIGWSAFGYASNAIRTLKTAAS